MPPLYFIKQKLTLTMLTFKRYGRGLGRVGQAGGFGCPTVLLDHPESREAQCRQGRMPPPSMRTAKKLSMPALSRPCPVRRMLGTAPVSVKARWSPLPASGTLGPNDATGQAEVGGSVAPSPGWPPAGPSCDLPIAQPSARLENPSISTARDPQPCSVGQAVMSPAQTRFAAWMFEQRASRCSATGGLRAAVVVVRYCGPPLPRKPPWRIRRAACCRPQDRSRCRSRT